MINFSSIFLQHLSTIPLLIWEHNALRFFMSEKWQEKQNNDEADQSDNFDFEARNNLVGFYDLLLKIDKRINPHLYENKKII